MRVALAAAALALALAGTAHAQAPGGLTPIVGPGGCFLEAPAEFPGCSSLSPAVPTSTSAAETASGQSSITAATLRAGR